MRALVAASAQLVPVCLPLRTPLATARGPIRERRGVLIALESEEGVRGWGEALPLPGFGSETPATAGKALEDAVRAWLRGEAPPCRPEAPTAAAALECARLDLEARQCGVSLARRLAPDAPRVARELRLSALVSGETPAELARAGAAALGAGFAAVKLKLGRRALAQELERVAALRSAVGPDCALRLDANRAYSSQEAAVLLAALAPQRPEYVEEPLAHPDAAGFAALRARVSVPLAADESLADPTLARALLAARGIDVAILKPPPLGGLRAGLALARVARASGVACVVTSFLDSSLGRAAAAQFAAALPGPARAAGLATGALLADDLARGREPRNGRLELPTGPGLGIAPDPAALERLATGPPVVFRA